MGLIGITTTITSCKKESATAFVKGEVLFSLYDSVSFQKTHELFDDLNIKIKQVYDFSYFVKTSLDSVDTIKQILASKNYLTNAGRTYRTRYSNDTLFISSNFFDFNDLNAKDWFDTVEELKLEENLSDKFNKWGLLNVPPGEEQVWVERMYN